MTDWEKVILLERENAQLRAALAERDREIEELRGAFNDTHAHNAQSVRGTIDKYEAELASLRSQLQAATARAEEAEDAFIDRLFVHLERFGIDASNWDGEDDPAEIIAKNIADLAQPDLPLNLTDDEITDWEADVLRHASNNGRYVTNEQRVIELATRGLMYDHGPQILAGGMHYLTMTGKGRSALNAWQEKQPKPKFKKRRISKQFQAWRDYEDAYGRLGFSDFLKTVWPECKYWDKYV